MIFFYEFARYYLPFLTMHNIQFQDQNFAQYLDLTHPTIKYQIVHPLYIQQRFEIRDRSLIVSHTNVVSLNHVLTATDYMQHMTVMQWTDSNLYTLYD